jgi:hypothetical protein
MERAYPVRRIRLGIPAELWINQMVDLDEVISIAFDWNEAVASGLKQT